MGYIPLLLTLGGFAVLFILTVNQSLNAKKNQIFRLQQMMASGFEKMGRPLSIHPSVSKEGLDLLETTFQKTKKSLDPSEGDFFEEHIRKPYQMLKLTKAAYNKLVIKKPYSFAASITGHKLIA